VRRRPPSPNTTTVKKQAQLKDICEACRSEGRFAFDTEFVMEDRFEPEVCLVQIATASSAAVIDPMIGLDLAPVWALVCDETIETIVHAGQEDLSLCVQHTGRVPRHVFDVQIAAGLCGYDYPLSLQKLVQATVHVRLHKAKTLTDWRRRPLSAEQIRYGAEDVFYLPAVREKLHTRLARLDRIAWLHEECARFEDLSLYRRAEEEKLLRIKGLGALKGQQLAVVRELLAWREEIARKLNRPVRVALRDHLLVEIARLGLSAFREIRDLRGLNLSDRHVRSLCSAVEKGLKTPQDRWPKTAPRDTETPKEAALVALVTAVARGYCLEHDLAYGLVASKRSIHELIRHVTRNRPENRDSVELCRGWRGHSIGALLEDVLTGRRTVRVHSANGETTVRASRFGRARPHRPTG
jgi:ribonuclease D